MYEGCHHCHRNARMEARVSMHQYLKLTEQHTQQRLQDHSTTERPQTKIVASQRQVRSSMRIIPACVHGTCSPKPGEFWIQAHSSSDVHSWCGMRVVRYHRHLNVLQEQAQRYLD